jgi:hypothetical protein
LLLLAALIHKPRPIINETASAAPATHSSTRLSVGVMLAARDVSLVSQNSSNVSSCQHIGEALIDIFERVFLSHHASKIELAVSIQLHEAWNV